ncbi:Cyclic phosphodiesterase-like protein [Fodinibius salinus]|uniref:Cyclic phosphodiesterase-like protein n=1 Tax=Fodinibius salinus TaxID=860790 RepID=A0A5D3YLE6_9BACT|nr:2'-5' RNA ligase family protein [Fodinibius salinus]TYP93507.1 Cyclic phosphodiesterase-like protein [Fodinibius salinus]
MSNTPTYSLWLEPGGDIGYKLKEQIQKLSKKYETPKFSPHLTLLGSLKGSETELTSLTNTLASSGSPFTVHLTKAGYRDRFYQSLFIHAEESSELMELRNIATELFEVVEDGFMPHLSLMYGDMAQDKKQRILNLIGREFYIRFKAKHLALVQTTGTPEQWKRIHTAVFKER